MRLFVAAIVVFMVPVAAAPTSFAGGHEAFLSDPAGDVVFETFLVPVNPPFPSPASDHLDVLGVWVANETEDTLDLGMRLRRWEPLAPSSLPWQRVVHLYFSIGNQNFTIGYPGFKCQTGEASIQRYRYFGAFPDLPVTCVRPRLAPAAGELVIPLPKSELMDHLYVPWQVGDSITGLHADARGVAALDKVPNTGPGIDFVSRVGSGVQQGDLRLSVEKPVRASNGEATTVLFKARLSNAGPDDRVVVLTIENSEPEWTIRAPQRVHVPANAVAQIPVILAMNFTHEHGQSRFFELRAQDQHDANHHASARLGIRWLDVPQPAGHHDRLWLHSRPNPNDILGTTVKMGDLGFVDAWMNALDQPPGGSPDVDIPPTRNAVRVTGAQWVLFLSPELEIGLDLEPSRPASFEASIRSPVAATRAQLNVTVAYCDMTRTRSGVTTNACNYGTQVDLLWGRVDLGTLTPNALRSFNVPLRMNASVDQLPYQPGSRLMLAVTLTADTPQDNAYTEGQLDAVLVPRGALLQLPLVEYHDPIDQAFEDIGSILLEPLDAHTKSVNPGRAAAFRFDVTNKAARPQTLHLSVEGINAPWAALQGNDRLTLAPNEKRMVAFLVHAPDDAAAGERAELFFVAENVDDPSIVALARVRAAVVELATADITDEASLFVGADVTGDRSPALPIALVLAGLVFVAWRHRRKE